MCLKKVCKKIYLKQLCLAKQSVYKLEEKEVKVLSTRVIVSSNLLVVSLLPLTSPFKFSPFFSLLPNLLSYNVCSVLGTKYIYCPILLNCLVPYLSCYRVLDLIRC